LVVGSSVGIQVFGGLDVDGNHSSGLSNWEDIGGNVIIGGGIADGLGEVGKISSGWGSTSGLIGICSISQLTSWASGVDCSREGVRASFSSV